MKAIVYDQPGPAEVLTLRDVPDLTPGPGELLIRVRATALNRADILQRNGRYPAPPGASTILGLEAAGEIAALGPGVADWQLGDRVCALLPGGGYAEQVVIPATMAMAIPADWSYEQAAAIPEVWMTSFDNLFNWGRLKAGESVLIHGGSSGIGTAAIQLARWRGAHVLVTAGSDAKLARCKELGAAEGINYKTEDWAARVSEITNGAGVHVILDIIGGPYFAANVQNLASEGRLVIIGLMGGVTSEINLGQVLARRLTICGTTLRPRPLAAKMTLTEQFKAEVWPALSDGRLQPIIDHVYDLAAAAEAHRAMEASEHIGKIVLRVGG